MIKINKSIFAAIVGVLATALIMSLLFNWFGSAENTRQYGECIGNMQIALSNARTELRKAADSETDSAEAVAALHEARNLLTKADAYYYTAYAYVGGVYRSVDMDFERIGNYLINNSQAGNLSFAGIAADGRISEKERLFLTRLENDLWTFYGSSAGGRKDQNAAFEAFWQGWRLTSSDSPFMLLKSE